MKTGWMVVMAVMFSVASFAQTITFSVNGAIINCTGMKEDTYTTVRKARQTDGTNDKLGINTLTNIGSAVSNAKVYYKFEVYKSDYNAEINWRNAVSVCKDLTIDKGNWRLPTLRELMLIWVLQPELNKITGFMPLSATNYWSATECYENSSWSVDFNIGSTNVTGKVNGFRVRCVRDL